MLDFIINNFDLLAKAEAECGLFSKQEFNLVHKAYSIFLIATPVLVILLCTLDMAKAVMAQDDGAIKKAQSSAIKRIIAGAIVFFIPILINLILNMNYTDASGKKISFGRECVTKINE